VRAWTGWLSLASRKMTNNLVPSSLKLRQPWFLVNRDPTTASRTSAPAYDDSVWADMRVLFPFGRPPNFMLITNREHHASVTWTGLLSITNCLSISFRVRRQLRGETRKHRLMLNDPLTVPHGAERLGGYVANAMYQPTPSWHRQTSPWRGHKRL